MMMMMNAEAVVCKRRIICLCTIHVRVINANIEQNLRSVDMEKTIDRKDTV